MYKGGVLCVSHDAHLIESIVDTLWVVNDDHTLTKFDGTFDEYRKSLLKKNKGH